MVISAPDQSILSLSVSPQNEFILQSILFTVHYAVEFAESILHFTVGLMLYEKLSTHCIVVARLR